MTARMWRNALPTHMISSRAPIRTAQNVRYITVSNGEV
jgi:hypothetical protein